MACKFRSNIAVSFLYGRGACSCSASLFSLQLDLKCAACSLHSHLSAVVLCLSVSALCTLGRDGLWAVLLRFHLKREVKMFNLRDPALRERAKGQEFGQHVFPSHIAMCQSERTQTQQAVQLQWPFCVAVPGSFLLWFLIPRTLHGMPGMNLIS